MKKTLAFECSPVTQEEILDLDIFDTIFEF